MREVEGWDQIDKRTGLVDEVRIRASRLKMIEGVLFILFTLFVGYFLLRFLYIITRLALVLGRMSPVVGLLIHVLLIVTLVIFLIYTGVIPIIESRGYNAVLIGDDIIYAELGLFGLKFRRWTLRPEGKRIYLTYSQRISYSFASGHPYTIYYLLLSNGRVRRKVLSDKNYVAVLATKQKLKEALTKRGYEVIET